MRILLFWDLNEEFNTHTHTWQTLSTIDLSEFHTHCTPFSGVCLVEVAHTYTWKFSCLRNSSSIRYTFDKKSPGIQSVYLFSFVRERKSTLTFFNINFLSPTQNPYSWGPRKTYVPHVLGKNTKKDREREREREREKERERERKREREREREKKKKSKSADFGGQRVVAPHWPFWAKNDFCGGGRAHILDITVSLSSRVAMLNRWKHRMAWSSWMPNSKNSRMCTVAHWTAPRLTWRAWSRSWRRLPSASLHILLVLILVVCKCTIVTKNKRSKIVWINHLQHHESQCKEQTWARTRKLAEIHIKLKAIATDYIGQVDFTLMCVRTVSEKLEAGPTRSSYFHKSMRSWVVWDKSATCICPFPKDTLRWPQSCDRQQAIGSREVMW